MSKKGSWGVSKEIEPQGFVLSTDPLKVDRSGNHMEWVERAAESVGQLPPYQGFYGEHYYWIAGEHTMNGAVEKATVFATVDEAESEAMLAAGLDPNLATHLHVMPLKDALERDKKMIGERERAAEAAKRYDEQRFRLGSKEGGI